MSRLVSYLLQKNKEAAASDRGEVDDGRGRWRTRTAISEEDDDDDDVDVEQEEDGRVSRTKNYTQCFGHAITYLKGFVLFLSAYYRLILTVFSQISYYFQPKGLSTQH